MNTGRDAEGQCHAPTECWRALAQMRASWYRQYANRLASWGFVCVQYDDPLLKIIDDATEVRPMGARPSACHVTDGRIAMCMVH